MNKNSEQKVIIQYEPSPTFQDDFCQFLEEILQTKEEKFKQDDGRGEDLYEINSKIYEDSSLGAA